MASKADLTAGLDETTSFQLQEDAEKIINYNNNKRIPPKHETLLTPSEASYFPIVQVRIHDPLLFSYT